MCSNSSHTFATICQLSLPKACNLTKFVCIGHSKQSHAVAVRLYLVPAMCNRLVQEAGKELQREESYKKMRYLRKHCEKLINIFMRK